MHVQLYLPRVQLNKKFWVPSGTFALYISLSGNTPQICLCGYICRSGVDVVVRVCCLHSIPTCSLPDLVPQ